MLSSRITFILLGLLASPVLAAVPTGFQETVYSSSALTPATGLAWAPDGSGRLFITQKNGKVLVATMRDGALVTQGATLATAEFASETVYTNSECGLIGIAFDPNYAVNRYVYLFLTATSSKQQIVRYTDSNGVGTARTVLVDNLPTAGQNHDGGAIGFGQDGRLYWAIGDLGNGTGVDADLVSMAAKVSRAHPDGTPANDNPFNDGVGPNNEYIWARGFRNPFTFTFQPGTGKLWVNTVGTGYEQIFVPSRGDHAGYNDFENNQPTGFITPAIKYRTNGTDTRNLTATGAVRSEGIVTFTTTGDHGLRKGEKITVAGVTDASFNGVFYVASVPGARAWTAAQTGPNAASGGGTAVTQDLGGSITGGIFYDSTLFPSDYRGNFFFGDYNSGRLVRATLAADNSVATVDAWGSGFTQAVDMDVGPDGALYVVGVTSNSIKRILPTATGQKLIVSALNVTVVEGGNSVFTVRLAEAPTEEVRVSVARDSGDTDLTVVSGAQFTFTPANWNQLQRIVLASAEDPDAEPDRAAFTVSAPGLSTETVQAVTIDDNTARLVLSSTALAMNEGDTASLTVALSKTPQRSVTVTVARTAGDTDITVSSGASLTFTPANWSTPQSVTVAAAEDADNTRDTATLTLALAGGDARTVSVTVKDNDPSAPSITSTPLTTAVVGALYRYEVVAEGLPAPTFSLTSSAQGPTLDATRGVLLWTPTGVGTVDMQVIASNGVNPDSGQSFQVTVKADEPPQAVLTRPTEGERVSGSTAEFFGDCVDDVGCTQAEFYVDGVLGSTDAQTSGHYHYGGEHNRWDTTSLKPGAHKVRMVVYDTAGQRAEAEVTVCVGDGECVPPEQPGPGDGGTEPDGGTEQPPEDDSSGCGCGAGPGGALAWLGLLLVLRGKRARGG
ncbi:PQQ-dependent sugar dehydrogenase [Stigmatella sp. ncwal1]|uniref:PQQ-dependent sugar dehydrogenase n=1 Tax=Stigmatella ashevillensis TaxID=2995309 RepID=A0ABT5DEU0_9BACT|nr:PQQ-dependent sugar dehydrogenase [Stigmatella ashevillena]MDC0712184.1 PQQ-dependent sugar dehydrogenase [Stigmatella ashevillena]